MALVSAAWAQAAPPAPAPATPVATAKIEEVLVTARQRKEKQVDVPISMQVFTAAKIKAAKIYDLNDLQFQAGFTFQQAASTAAGGREFPALIMRGLQSTYGGGQDNSGSLFVDGIYVSAGQASVDTADVTRIEVLKGPQNVYFGKNTFGGAINFITSNPSDTFSGSTDVSASERGSVDFNATAEGPLVPGLLDARVSVEDYNKAAQYHTTDGGDLGAEKTVGVTGTLYATPLENLWVRVRGHYQQDDDSAADLGFLPGSVYGSDCNGGRGTDALGNPVPIQIAAPYFCGSIPSLGQTGTSVLDQNTALPPAFAQALDTNTLTPSNGYPAHDPVLGDVPRLNHSGLRRNLASVSGQSGYQLPYGLDLSTSAGYNQSASNDIWDLDRSPNQVYINDQPIVSRDLTLDARVSTRQNFWLRGLVGASYFHSKYELSQDGDNFYGYAPLAAFYDGVSMSSFENESDDTKAVYGSLDVDIMPWLTATAEARYQHDRITDFSISGDKYTKAFNNVLPRFILKFHPRPDWDFYGSFSKGIQPPSLQTGFINASAPQRAYLQTVVPGVNEYSPLATLNSFEIGAKQELFHNRLVYGIALYDEEWNHQQTTAAVFNPAGCGLTQFTPACPLANYGSFLYLSNKANIKGIEFNGSAQITDQLSADLTVDYTRPKWVDYYNSTLASFTGGVSHFDGNTISRVPDWQGEASATYRDRLVGQWDYYLRGQVTFTGSMYESEVNLAKTNAYARLNAAVGVTRGALNIELWGKNLTNDKNWDFASRVPDLSNSADLFTGYGVYQGVLVQAPDRLDVGLKVSYKF